MKEHLEALIGEFACFENKIDTIYQWVRMTYGQLPDADAGDYRLVLDVVEQWRNECKYRSDNVITVIKEVTKFWRS